MALESAELGTTVFSLSELAERLAVVVGRPVSVADIKATSWAICLPMRRVADTLYQVDRDDFGRFAAALRR
jgi:hypothetical protein